MKRNLPLPAKNSTVEMFFRFLKESFQNFKVTGAVAPSSRFLAEKMLQSVSWNSTQRIIEYGPGTGAFTRVVLEKKAKEAEFVGIEINPLFVKQLQKRFPAELFIEESVEFVDRVCQQKGWDSVDLIVSGLPWAFFSTKQQELYMKKTLEQLSPHGIFVTMAYQHGLFLPSGRSFQKVLQKTFSTVELSSIEWRNIPPARVYCCKP